MTSKITPLFLHLRSRALATGQDQRSDLGHGARLAVRVAPLDGGRSQVALTIARCGARVGSSEEVVFRRDCGVPQGARRWPEDPLLQVHRAERGRTRYVVGYTWEVEAEAERSAA